MGLENKYIAVAFIDGKLINIAATYGKRTFNDASAKAAYREFILNNPNAETVVIEGWDSNLDVTHFLPNRKLTTTGISDEDTGTISVGENLVVVGDEVFLIENAPISPLAELELYEYDYFNSMVYAYYYDAYYKVLDKYYKKVLPSRVSPDIEEKIYSLTNSRTFEDYKKLCELIKGLK